MNDLLGAGKVIEKVVDPIMDIVKKIAGPAAEEIGLSIQDSIKVYRAERQYRLFEKMRRFVVDAGYDPGRIPLRVLLPSLTYASVEENDDLHTMWAALLANAARPDVSEMPSYFPDILHQLSTADALMLVAMTLRSRPFKNAVERLRSMSSCIGKEEPEGPTQEQLLRMWSVAVEHRSDVEEDAPFAREEELFLISIDNLVRLGLVHHCEKLQFPRMVADERIFLPYDSKQSFRITPLGWRFVKTCTAPKLEEKRDSDYVTITE